MGSGSPSKSTGPAPCLGCGVRKLAPLEPGDYTGQSQRQLLAELIQGGRLLSPKIARASRAVHTEQFSQRLLDIRIGYSILPRTTRVTPSSIILKAVLTWGM